MDGQSEYSEEDLLRIYSEVSNTGRWGADDELGTLNHITPGKRVEAARLVTHGLTLSLARPLSTAQSIENPRPPLHVMVAGSRSAHSPSAYDFFGGAPHGRSFTHLDAVAHSNFEGSLYNGRRVEEVYTSTGLSFGSVFAQRQGIVTRGVLLDVAAARGVAHLSSSDTIRVADLEEAERRQSVRVSTGDVLLIHSGYLDWQRSVGDGPAHPPEDAAGIDPGVILWLHEREVAVFGGDCVEKSHPSERFDHLPLHRIAIPSMGLILLDYPDVEPLARTCAELGRFEFLFTTAPIALPRATGSFVNPIAVF